ncbi:heavy-metal-associated domain-containing protein, partial [Nitrospinae bacterium AH_259_B05_G02_I21]|nr:heavy-metal-associated domain-containing protein [Nitrospinae bacterium AH_259_B05_G02_I21]
MRADIEQMVLRVDGLACPFCAYGLEKKLSRLEGVQELDIEMDSGTVTLSLEQGAVISPDELNKAVSD